MSQEVLDPKELNLSEGTILVKIARKAIEEYLSRGVIIDPPKDVPKKLLKLGMSFVTILRYPSNELRGCIGYTQPFEPLIKNVVSAAIAASTQDPRFPPMNFNEVSNVIIEVSVLSVPIELKSRGVELIKDVFIGKDGLIIDYGIYKGLLLPEVPVEHCWDEETFLSETCLKTGLKPDCWLSDKVKVLKYYTKTFREVRPYGGVIERDLRREYESRCLK